MADRPLEPFVWNVWHLAAWSHEIQDAPLARTILGEPVALFRDGEGRAAALEDRCCHRAAPLTQGRVIPEGLECGYHGMVFDGTGACVVNPGEPAGPAGYSVRSYPVVERQHFVWIWMGDPALAEESKIIDYPYHDDTREWPFKFDVIHMPCNYMLLIDNLMDLSHLGFIHNRTIGAGPKVHTRAIQESVPTDTGARFDRWILDCPPPPTFAKAGGFTTNIDRWSDFEYVAPGAVLQWTGALETGRGAQQNRNQDGAFSIRLYHGATPETESTCHYFWSAANGYRQDDPQAGQELYDDIAATFHEDKVFLETQQAMIMHAPNRPLDTRSQDKAVVLARRALDRMIEEDRAVASAAE